MDTPKVRRQFYMSRELAEKLDALAAKPGGSLTAIMTDAATAWLERKGAQELDARFGPRLARLDRLATGNEYALILISQMLFAFIQHQLTLAANHPPFDEATTAAGERRFNKMLDLAVKGVETTRNMSRRPVPPSSPSEPAS